MLWKLTSTGNCACYLSTAAHESNFDTRNAQYLRICQSVFAKSTSGCSSCVQPSTITDELDCKMPGVTSNLVEESDVVVWLGDLNYRVELPRSSVHFLINHKLQEVKSHWTMHPVSLPFWIAHWHSYAHCVGCDLPDVAPASPCGFYFWILAIIYCWPSNFEWNFFYWSTVILMTLGILWVSGSCGQMTSYPEQCKAVKFSEILKRVHSCFLQLTNMMWALTTMTPAPRLALPPTWPCALL